MISKEEIQKILDGMKELAEAETKTAIEEISQKVEKDLEELSKKVSDQDKRNEK